MKTVINLLLLLYPLFLFSQKEESTIIYIKDYDENPISYANIYNVKGKFGIAANNEGKAIFKHSKISNEDMFTVSALGFSDTIIQFSKITENAIIHLSKKSIFLNEFTISTEVRKEVNLGAKRNNSFRGKGYSAFYEGFQVGLYIPHDSNHIRLKRLEIFVTDLGRFDTPFRIRLYRTDTSKLPIDDITKESFILKANKGNEWVKLDLSEYNIYIPKEGVIVAVEWINCGEEYFYESDSRTTNYYGIVLGMSTDINAHNSCWFHWEHGWYKRPLGNDFCLNPTIKVICD